MPQSAAAAAAAIAAVNVAAVDTPPPKPDHLQGMLADKAAHEVTNMEMLVRVNRVSGERMEVPPRVDDFNQLLSALENSRSNDGKGLAPRLWKRRQPASTSEEASPSSPSAPSQPKRDAPGP